MFPFIQCSLKLSNLLDPVHKCKLPTSETYTDGFRVSGSGDCATYTDWNGSQGHLQARSHCLTLAFLPLSKVLECTLFQNFS